MRKFSVSKGVIGLEYTGVQAVFTTIQFPSSVLSERFGERLVILAALGFTALSSVLVTLSSSYLLFLLVIVGIDAGLFTTVAARY